MAENPALETWIAYPIKTTKIRVHNSVQDLGTIQLVLDSRNNAFLCASQSPGQYIQYPLDMYLLDDLINFLTDIRTMKGTALVTMDDKGNILNG